MCSSGWTQPFISTCRTTLLPSSWTLAPVISGLWRDISVEQRFRTQFKTVLCLPFLHQNPQTICLGTEFLNLLARRLLSILQFCYCAHLDVPQLWRDENLGTCLLLNGLLDDTSWLLQPVTCCEAVTQAITKPYHVSWWGFADGSTDMNWLHLLLEYIYLLKSLPAGCAVHLFPSNPPCKLCVLRGEQQEETWKCYLQTWDNKAMDRECKIVSFFPVFFFLAHERWAVRPYTAQLCHPKHSLLFSRSFSLLPLQTIT